MPSVLQTSPKPAQILFTVVLQKWLAVGLVWFCICSRIQSNHIEVAQRGVSSRATNNWLCLFESGFFMALRAIFFLTFTTIFLKRKKKNFFCPSKNEKKPSKFGHNRPHKFFLVLLISQNKPTSHFLFHKNVLYNDFGSVVCMHESYGREQLENCNSRRIHFKNKRSSLW